MKEAIVYLFKKPNLLFDYIVVIPFGVAMVIFLITLIPHPLALLMTCAVPGVLLFYHVYSIRVIQQFINYDSGKRVEISQDRLILKFTQGDKTITIHSDEVAIVELYEAKELGKITNPSYLIIHTTDGRDLLITQFTIRLLLFDKPLEKFLRKKPRIYHKQLFNFIKK